MTNEQAIKVLTMVEAHGSLVIKAKEMAIKALQEQTDRNEFYNWDAPIRHKADGEYISRKALLEDLYKRDYTKFTHRDFVALVQYQDIVAIPNKTKTGHCIDCKYFRILPLHSNMKGRCIHHGGFCPNSDWYCADFEMD